MLIEFAAREDGDSLQQTIEKRQADWAGQCYTDYALHVMLPGNLPPAVIDEIPEGYSDWLP